MDRPCAEWLAGLGHSSGSQVTRLVQAPANQDGDADAVWEFEKATPCRSRKQDAVTAEVAVLPTAAEHALAGGAELGLWQN